MAQVATAPLRAVSGRPPRKGGRNAAQRRFVCATLVPLALLFIVFWIYPVLNGLWGSFTDWRAFSPDRQFVGLRNYARLVNDSIFITALVNTLQFAAMYLPLQIACGLGLALAIEASGKLKSFFRTVYFLPVVTSVIATSLIFKWLYQPTLGLFNQLLELAGLPTLGFLQSPSQALASIVFYTLWKSLGVTMVLFMAGLNGIDRSFYEAAKVDGGSRWPIFWQITVPLLRPTTILVLVTGIINTLQVFEPIFIMSSVGENSPPGGPANSTTVVAIYQWATAFEELDLGYGMAMGIALFAIILVVTLAQSRLLKQSWEY